VYSQCFERRHVRLKENVIMGRLVPAGTGMEYYRRVKIAGEDVIEKSRWSNQGLEKASPDTTKRLAFSTLAGCRKAPEKDRWRSNPLAFIDAPGGNAWRFLF